MRLVIATVLMALSLTGVAAGDRPLYVYGGKGHKEFLGCINCEDTDPKSVWNNSSQYGFRNIYGAWSRSSQYVDPSSDLSSCNQLATDPPIIKGEDGRTYGRLSLNEHIQGSVCGFGGRENLCLSVRILCKGK